MKKIPQDLFHQFHFLTDLHVRNGRIAFVSTTQRVKENDYVGHIFLLENGKTRQITSGKSERSFIFLDDDTILFPANRNEDKRVHTEFHLLSLSKGGEAQPAFNIPLAVDSIKDTGDYYLLSGMCDLGCPDYHLLSEEKQLEYEKYKEDNQDYQVVDEYPFMFNGIGFINKTRNSLYLMDKKDNSIKRIVPDTMDVESFDYKDGKILISGIDFTAVKGKWSQIYCYDIEKEDYSCLYEKEDMLISGVKFYGDKILVLGTFGRAFGVTESSKMFLFENGQMNLFVDEDMSLWNSVGSDSKLGHGKGMEIVDGTIYFNPTIKSNAPLKKIAGNRSEYVTNFNGAVCDFCFDGDRLYVIAMEEQNLQEIYEVNEDGSLKQLSHVNDDILKDYYVAKPNKLIVHKEECDVEGWVLLPEDYDEKKTYPGILDIHGGPRTAYGELYFHEMQYWANLGFVVFFCNPRGSDGYGNAFSDIRQDKYGTIDYEDIMDFTDAVEEKYHLDPKRIAVTGGSYGGFMTNWIIGHTDRFCCAASQRSISNWMSMLAASDYGIDVPFEMGFDDIYDCTKEIWRVSPLKYAQNVKTPTLFIHSFEDYRCPYPEGMQLFTAIRCQGVDARMCLFKGENHELSRSGKPLHRSRRLKEITEWICKYTKQEI